MQLCIEQLLFCRCRRADKCCISGMHWKAVVISLVHCSLNKQGPCMPRSLAGACTAAGLHALQ